MADLATLQAHRTQLEAARASGELTVRMADGRLVTFKSGADIERSIAAVDREMAEITNSSQPSAVRVRTQRG